MSAPVQSQPFLYQKTIVYGRHGWCEELVDAVRENDVATVERALANGATVSQACFSRARCYGGFDYDLLVEACEFEDLQIAKMLLQNEPSLIEAEDHRSCSRAPLTGTSKEGYYEGTKFLLDSGANVHAGNEDALRFAEDVKVVRLLLDRGARFDVLDSKGQGLLHNACDDGYVDKVKFVVNELGMSIFSWDNEGKTPFDIVLENLVGNDDDDDYKTIREFLLSTYLNICFQASYGFSIHGLIRECSYRYSDPKHIRVPLGRVPVSSSGVTIFESVLAHFPKCIGTRNNDGSLPLHIACARGLPPLILRLLVGPDDKQLLLSGDKRGRLPIHMLCSHAAQPLCAIKFLVEQGGKDMLSFCDATGSQPLHLLCQNCEFLGRCKTTSALETLNYLLRSNPVSLSTRTLEGDVPLTLAGNCASLDVIFTLLRASPTVLPSSN